MNRRKLVVGNWKMHGTRASLAELDAIAAAARANPEVDVVVCPPFTLIAVAAERDAIPIGGQDCHPEEKGAHTGDVSAAMLKDAGASLVIVGHSERRADHSEGDALVRAKAEAALAAGLTTIICVGETEAERDAGRAVEVVDAKLRGSVPPGATADRLVISYEPVWAIGTGRTPTTAQIAEMHAAVRATLAELLGDQAGRMRILYGGSVKPANAKELMSIENLDGALVGGASLTAAEFVPIITAASGRSA